MKVLLSLFYKWGNVSLDKLNSLDKNTQTLKDNIGIWLWPFRPQGTILNPKCKCLMWINVGVGEEMKVFIEEVGFGLGHEG